MNRFSSILIDSVFVISCLLAIQSDPKFDTNIITIVGSDYSKQQTASKISKQQFSYYEQEILITNKTIMCALTAVPGGFFHVFLHC